MQMLAILFGVLGVFFLLKGRLAPSKQHKNQRGIDHRHVTAAQQQAGEQGEPNVRLRLQALDREAYTVFNDIHLSFDRIEHQLDHLVVGPCGVVHIESKNYGGQISFTMNGLEQIGSNGEFVIHSDPAAQLSNQEGLVREIVKTMDCAIPIYGVLCISNDRTIIEGIPEDFHVCKDAVIVPYIQKLPIVLDEPTHQQLVRTLRHYEGKEEATA
ncbi:nuclease-related domain-containing protein [Ammoniphilus resinae]|uniref:NERD domain-containing protein n=1 Tax=Ammoniphilus resinae TaxID=861532 RepID=A0ABS4GWL9_9BACL|nr:nuclease-related domain-containing protein [Ammoniphilus resinae]MBP1934668.1 hypothetical protein [Ammoniphilus resinae]